MFAKKLAILTKICKKLNGEYYIKMAFANKFKKTKNDNSATDKNFFINDKI